jgi:uncharacterized RDD family membrane protein YckC
LAAFAVDWLIIAAWGGLLFFAVMLATGGNPPRAQFALMSQAIGLVTMTLPVTLYFALCESSTLRASLGKRALRLAVVDEHGQQLTRSASLLRTIAKFAPWECGHTLAQQAIFSGEDALPVWVWGPAAVALVGPIWWIVSLLTTGRTPYDRWTRANVVRADRGAPSSANDPRRLQPESQKAGDTNDLCRVMAQIDECEAATGSTRRFA